MIKFLNVENKIKKLDQEILNFEKEILVLKQQKTYSPDLVPIFIDRDVENFENILKVKNKQRDQLLEERQNSFTNKIFWSVIIPIIVTVVTTLLLNNMLLNK